MLELRNSTDALIYIYDIKSKKAKFQGNTLLEQQAKKTGFETTIKTDKGEKKIYIQFSPINKASENDEQFHNAFRSYIDTTTALKRNMKWLRIKSKAV